MRKEHNRINQQYNNNPMIHLSCFLKSISGDYLEINPFRFDLRNGKCHGTTLMGQEKHAKFW